jgi:hypothetical protein
MADYNWEMTGAPDPSVAWTDPEAAASYNNFVAQQNAASGGAGQQLPSIDNSGNFVAPPAPTEPPIWLRPESYTSEGFAAPYTQEQANTAVDPNNIRQGYGGAYYSGLQGNTSYFDPTSAGEYLVDPSTNKFLKDASGNLIPVPQKPNNPGQFGDFISDKLIPGMIAAGAIGTGLGAAGLIGQSAAIGGGTGLTSGGGATGLGTGSGYAGIGLNPALQTGGEFAYSGLGLNPAITGSAGIGLDATIPSITSGLATNAGALAGASGIPITAAEFAGAGGLTASQAAALDSALTAAEAGGAGLTASQLANLLKGVGTATTALTGGKSATGAGSQYANLLRQPTSGYAQSAPGGLYKGNVNPFTFAKDQPIQNKPTTSYDPFAALNVAQTPVNYSPNAAADILRKYEG